jgi:hypothetical protein
MGIMRGLRDTVFLRDFNGIVRAWAILAGLIVTAAGYIAGKLFPDKPCSCT